jgi:hypothetical protein
VSLCAFYFCRLIGKLLGCFFAVSGVEHAQHKHDQFRFRRASFYSQLKYKVGNILAKATALRINLNIDGAPISRSQTSRLLSTSLSLSIPFPRSTSVCARLSPPPTLALRLSLHRHPFFYIPPSSRFIRYNNNKNSFVLRQLTGITARCRTTTLGTAQMCNYRTTCRVACRSSAGAMPSAGAPSSQ